MVPQIANNDSSAHVQSLPGELPQVLRESFDVEQLYRMAAVRLSQLCDDAKQRFYAPQRFAEAFTVLASLPLTQHQFSLASRRLDNARNYIEVDEWGAGWFELNLAARTILSIAP